ncbi:hypothetical protein ACYG9Z_24805 [Mesorhizobium sp. RSR380A]|uniref:hypothetical protein n=1 Tax=Mesorhizobium sp. LNJC380A00 TaxID=1287264 RepID=UPI0012EC73ED|nr:hypothetical protein [Mesorhizobium sp. LNJC380A00]
MKLSLNGRFYRGIARLFMPPLQQALRRRRDFVGGRLPKKEETRNPDWEAYATRSFRRFSELLNLISGVCLGRGCCAAARWPLQRASLALWHRNTACSI